MPLLIRYPRTTLSRCQRYAKRGAVPFWVLVPALRVGKDLFQSIGGSRSASEANAADSVLFFARSEMRRSMPTRSASEGTSCGPRLRFGLVSLLAARGISPFLLPASVRNRGFGGLMHCPRLSGTLMRNRPRWSRSSVASVHGSAFGKMVSTPPYCGGCHATMASWRTLLARGSWGRWLFQ
jgi:hypothetical protein